MGEEVFASFRNALTPFNLHRASEHAARSIFGDYFTRRAPFDGEGGKSVQEFPDAFVIAALGDWCDVGNRLM